MVPCVRTAHSSRCPTQRCRHCAARCFRSIAAAAAAVAGDAACRCASLASPCVWQDPRYRYACDEIVVRLGTTVQQRWVELIDVRVLGCPPSGEWRTDVRTQCLSAVDTSRRRTRSSTLLSASSTDKVSNHTSPRHCHHQHQQFSIIMLSHATPGTVTQNNK